VVIPINNSKKTSMFAIPGLGADAISFWLIFFEHLSLVRHIFLNYFFLPLLIKDFFYQFSHLALVGMNE
jgi:hypothetical protein